MCIIDILFVFFFKQKTAYEMRISDWSSDVCSSDLRDLVARADDDDIADGHRLERQLDERTIPEHPCGLGLQADEALDGLAGAALGARLQQAAHPDQRPEDRGSLVIDVVRLGGQDRKRQRLNHSHSCAYRVPSYACKKKTQ